MPDYSKLHKLVSHRVSIRYDTGAKIVGMLAGCEPGMGQVQFVTLTHAELIDADGKTLKQYEEIALSPNVVTGLGLDEGPLGRD